jgi:hypothetical protein
VEIQDFAAEYEHKTDEELLRLALDSEQLIPEANSALNSELVRRRINTAERLAAFRDQEEQRKQQERKDPGRLFLLVPYGIGRKRFGEAERTRNDETGRERFKTTVFFVLFWFPLIPTRTFIVERKLGFRPEQISILENVPLDWEQVLKVWVTAASTLLVLVLIFKLLPRFL